MFQTSSNLLSQMADNLSFLLVCLITIVAIYAIAILGERFTKHSPSSISLAKKVTFIGIFSGIAFVLMMFSFPLWFAPNFYKIDISDVPVLICAFTLGPVAAVLAELCKVLLNLIISGTSTAFVGEFSNFIIGCFFVVPASILYRLFQTKQSAYISVVVGTIIMTVFGTVFNALYLLPKYAVLYGIPLDSLIGMGTAINPNITDITSFVLFAVAPFNLLKGSIISIVTLLLYKKIRFFLLRTSD